MEAHSIDTWMTILSNVPAPDNAEHAAANRIIGDLVGYRHSSRYRARDIEELANAMQAYARMCAAAGWKP